jgi:hypothetical protein
LGQEDIKALEEFIEDTQALGQKSVYSKFIEYIDEMVKDGCLGVV